MNNAIKTTYESLPETIIVPHEFASKRAEVIILVENETAQHRQEPTRDLPLLRTLVQDYEHIHTAIGIIGNLLFVVGSVLFFKALEQYYTLAVSLFVIGSAFMLVGSLGSGLRRMWERREKEPSFRKVELAGNLHTARTTRECFSGSLGYTDRTCRLHRESTRARDDYRHTAPLEPRENLAVQNHAPDYGRDDKRGGEGWNDSYRFRVAVRKLEYHHRSDGEHDPNEVDRFMEQSAERYVPAGEQGVRNLFLKELRVRTEKTGNRTDGDTSRRPFVSEGDRNRANDDHSAGNHPWENRSQRLFGTGREKSDEGRTDHDQGDRR